MILDKIVDAKRLQLQEEMAGTGILSWEKKLEASEIKQIIDFKTALNKENKVAIIGEIKKASPSKGLIRPKFHPVELAKEYIEAGIDAFSVLTEIQFFQGSDKYLTEVSQISPIPVLRKDFIIDERQIYQARLIGADAILLIAAILTKRQMEEFQHVAGDLGLSCLVEVHDRMELETALETEARIIGINNRNLQTFEVSLKTTEELVRHIPGDRIVVSESGIDKAEDMKRLKEYGVNAALIGESFMKAKTIKEKLNELQ